MKQDESSCEIVVDLEARLLYLTFHFVTVALDHQQAYLLIDQLWRKAVLIAPWAEGEPPWKTYRPVVSGEQPQ